MSARCLVHLTVLAVAVSSLSIAALTYVASGFVASPADIAVYHLAGPPDVLAAIRWLPRAVTGTALAALAATALAAWGLFADARARRRAQPPAPR